MVVYELLGTDAWIDWASRGSERRIGIFSTAEKAEAKIKEIKKYEHWEMDWEKFRVIKVKVE